MAATEKANVIVPDVYEDAIEGAFAGLSVFGGSPAVIAKPGLPGTVRGGDKVQIPKFSVFGDLTELTESEAIVPVGLTLTAEEAVVKRYGAGLSFSAWSQMASIEDPYAEGARQLKVGTERASEAQLIAAAVKAGSDLLVHDISAIGNGKISYDALVDAAGKFGDEQQDIVGVFAHSASLTALRKVKLSDGTPAFFDARDGGQPRFMGYPLHISDRLPVTEGVYDTLILRRGALALWYASAPKVETKRDPAKDEDSIFVNAYFAAHRYSRVGGGTKSGVSVLRHKV